MLYLISEKKKKMVFIQYFVQRLSILLSSLVRHVKAGGSEKQFISHGEEIGSG